MSDAGDNSRSPRLSGFSYEGRQKRLIVDQNPPVNAATVVFEAIKVFESPKMFNNFMHVEYVVNSSMLHNLDNGQYCRSLRFVLAAQSHNKDWPGRGAF